MGRVGDPDQYHQRTDHEALNPAPGIGTAGSNRIASQEYRAKQEAAEQQVPVNRHRAGSGFGTRHVEQGYKYRQTENLCDQQTPRNYACSQQ